MVAKKQKRKERERTSEKQSAENVKRVGSFSSVHKRPSIQQDRNRVSLSGDCSTSDFVKKCGKASCIARELDQISREKKKEINWNAF